MQQRIKNSRQRLKKSDPFSQKLFSAFTICCVGVCIMALFSACNSITSAQANGKTVITEMDYWTSGAQDAALTGLIQQYEKLHPNILIERNSVPYPALMPKAVQEAASHTLPDLIALDNPTVASFAATGVLQPLDSFVHQQYQNSDFYSGPLSTMQYNGKIYGFPLGNNDLGIFYNKKMFADAHLNPPKTWSELTQDAKILTKGNTYGFVFSADADEEGTWQYEPFLWENGGDLNDVSSPQAVSALQFLTNMVQNGSASHGVLNWTQVDVETQFQEGHAAMMENGPWNIPLLEQAHIDYGVVPLPVPSANVKPATPLGGEELCVSTTHPQTQQATLAFLRWLTQPQQMVVFDKASGYIPPIKSTAQTFLQDQPQMQVFAGEFNSARSRTASLGTKYPAISQTIQSAEQSALAGVQSPQEALTIAREHIASVMNG
jgi:multiple sugar transport system substrate-binding protein